MGFATPFPEPESPELRQFVLDARPQVVAVLRALCDEAPQVNVFVGGGTEFEVARLLDVDELAGRLYCDLPSAQTDWPAQSATFVGFVGSDKVQFQAQGSTGEAGRERRRLSLPLPASLMLMRRRKAERTVSEGGSSGWLRLPVRPWTDRPLPVCDLASGGLAVEVDGTAELPPVGTQIVRCRLDLPGVGGAEVTLVVRHCSIVSGRQGVMRIGCEFLKPLPSVGAMVEGYLRCRGKTRAARVSWRTGQQSAGMAAASGLGGEASRPTG